MSAIPKLELIFSNLTLFEVRCTKELFIINQLIGKCPSFIWNIYSVCIYNRNKKKFLNTTEIFGIRVSVGEADEFLVAFIKLAKDRVSAYILFMNSHMLYENKKNDEFRKIVDNAVVVCPDGVPLLYSIKYFGKSNVDRIAGNDFIFSLVEMAEKEGLRVFFYGSTNEVLAKIKQKIQKEYSALKCKMYSPPFRSLSEHEMNQHAQLINDFQANIVLVGLGCPKQEYWMNQMKHKVNAPMFGVGGAFLFFAGIDSRAPKWMRNSGFEWLYRLVLEPRRLFKRYFITNSYFCWLFIKEVLKKK